MDFDTASDEDMQRAFLNIISLAAKDNTYKFAMARFLLDYSCEHDREETHVEFARIAEYFLRYYWPQICNLKMRHAPQADKKPEVVRIIEKEFGTSQYPQPFQKISLQEPEKIRRCVDRIEKECFHNVAWRFQRTNRGRATEEKIFFKYGIDRVVNPNKKYVDLARGIDLNPRAMDFFRKRGPILLKAVILEWARFLERMNAGLPKIIEKTEGRAVKRGSLEPYKRMLKPFFCDCFYCGGTLTFDAKNSVHVDHVLPRHYIWEDDIWNLTLACRDCNLKKRGALPPPQCVNKLIERNRKYAARIPRLAKSLALLDPDPESAVRRHYGIAQSYCYMISEEEVKTWCC